MNKNYIKEYLQEIKKICDLIDQNQVENFIKKINEVKINNGRIFILGVGGSAANASHAVNDFRKILNIEAYAITDNVSELTARINDESWEDSYKNCLKVSRISSKDCVLIFSVGGGSETTSKNLVNAMKYSKECGTKILSVVSKNGGAAKEFSDCYILIPIVEEKRITGHAEEWQSIVLHLVVNYFYE